jgi:hypothetical protein
MISNAELEGLLEENESLRDEVRQLRGQAPHGSIKGNALCRGCYKLRLVLAMFIGMPAAAGCWSLFGNKQVFAPFQSFVGFSDNSHAAMVWKAAAVVIAAVLPLTAVACNWKWRLFKNGYPGLLRGIAECRRAFKEGRGRK